MGEHEGRQSRTNAPSAVGSEAAGSSEAAEALSVIAEQR